MIKESRRERLSNTADSKPFLFVSSSVHFQLGAGYTQIEKREGGDAVPQGELERDQTN